MLCITCEVKKIVLVRESETQLQRNIAVIQSVLFPIPNDLFPIPIDLFPTPSKNQICTGLTDSDQNSSIMMVNRPTSTHPKNSHNHNITQHLAFFVE